MKTLYFDLSMGAAGDMLAAALFQLSPEPEALLAQVNGLGLPGVEVRLAPAEKCGIQGLHYEVLVHGQEEQEHHQHHGHQGLQHTDDGGLPAGLLQLGQAELVADGEGDEAQRHVVEQGKRLDLAHRGEAQAGDTQPAQAVRADEDARDQITGDGRHLQRLDKARNQQARAQRDGNGKQRLHVNLLLLSIAYFAGSIIALRQIREKMQNSTEIQGKNWLFLSGQLQIVDRANSRVKPHEQVRRFFSSY